MTMLSTLSLLLSLLPSGDSPQWARRIEWSPTDAPPAREHAAFVVDAAFVAAVLERIGRHDGWICRSSGTSPEIIASDIASVRNYLGGRRSMDSFTMSHAQWLHIVDGTDRDAIIAEQLRAYRTVMDKKRSDEHLQDAYLFGTIDEMTARIRELQDSGVDHLILNPLSPDPDQIELFSAHILPNI